VQPGVTEAWLERKISLSIAQERELVIDPSYFQSISETIARISGAEILLKRGSSYELTRYRYDVVLRVEGKAASACRKSNSLALPTEDGTNEGRPLATDPMAAVFLQHLSMELGKVLRAQFSEAQSPEVVIALTQRDFAEIVQASSLVPGDPSNNEVIEAQA
jgi:hypothetical protein